MGEEEAYKRVYIAGGTDGEIGEEDKDARLKSDEETTYGK